MSKPTAELIKEKCDALCTMLIEKNKAYGDSALKPMRLFSKAPADELIKVRIDDKLSRIMKGDVSAFGEDVVKDLLGYFILLQIAVDQREDAAVAAEPKKAHYVAHNVANPPGVIMRLEEEHFRASVSAISPIYRAAYTPDDDKGDYTFTVYLKDKEIASSDQLNEVLQDTKRHHEKYIAIPKQ